MFCLFLPQNIAEIYEIHSQSGQWLIEKLHEKSQKGQLGEEIVLRGWVGKKNTGKCFYELNEYLINIWKYINVVVFTTMFININSYVLPLPCTITFQEYNN